MHRRIFTLALTSLLALCTDIPNSYRGMHWHPSILQIVVIMYRQPFSPSDALRTLLLSRGCTDNPSSLREMLWQPYFSQCAALHVLHSHADWCTSNPRSSRGMHWQLFLLQIEALTKTSKLLLELLPLLWYKWHYFSLFRAPYPRVGYLNGLTWRPWRMHGVSRQSRWTWPTPRSWLTGTLPTCIGEQTHNKIKLSTVYCIKG